jgi:hypothetical protein
MSKYNHRTGSRGYGNVGIGTTGGNVGVGSTTSAPAPNSAITVEEEDWINTGRHPDAPKEPSGDGYDPDTGEKIGIGSTTPPSG